MRIWRSATRPSAAVAKIRPKFALFTSPVGLPNFGVLVRLNTSVRNSRRRFPPSENVRNTEKSMLRADLKVRLKFVAKTAVIDRNHVPGLQVPGDIVNPIEHGLVECSGFSRKRALDQHKLVALEIDKFFHAVADQAHRHRVEQLVGKMNAHE